MSKQLIIAVVIAAVVAGGGGFYGGVTYDKSQAVPGRPGTFSQRQGQSGGNTTDRRTGNVAPNGNLVSGQIISKDPQGITIKLQSGGSRIVLLSGSTTISKAAQGTLDDLQVNDNVMVTGKTNSDGSFTADTISLRPSMPDSTPPPVAN